MDRLGTALLVTATCVLLFCTSAAVPSDIAPAAVTAASPAQFFVSPSGTPAGDGSLERPWDLRTALSQPPSVRPGDTIWLRGGTYTGSFTSRLNGTEKAPILVRQYPGEWVRLDGGDSRGIAVLLVSGSYTWFWGFEITSSDLKRATVQAGPFPSDVGRGDGVASSPDPSRGLKFINLVVHDLRQGFSAFSSWSDTEIYGCLIYYNGWDGPDNGHGHGIYTQNQTGAKHVLDSILFHQFGHGIHAYGSHEAFLNNFDVRGNTLFLNGDLGTRGQGRNLLLGGNVLLNNATVDANAVYYPGNGGASDFDLGYSTGCQNATVTGNYVATNTYFVNCLPTSMTQNTFIGTITGFAPSGYPDNQYHPSRPSGTRVILRPNLYEEGRAHLTVFNWDLLDAVTVDLTGVLSIGDRFEIRNAQDYFGAPVVLGIFDGAPVSIPMAGLSTAAPVGWPTPAPTGPEFNAFVVQTTQAARAEPRATAPEGRGRVPVVVERP